MTRRMDQSQANILIVDDEPANVRLLEAMLRMDGYTSLTTVTDPREIEPLYRERRFDIVLLDINMPYLDGFQVMEILRSVHASDYPPVLVTTADTDDRVVPGHSFKYAAALQAANPAGAPHLIRIETRAGHGSGKPTDKIIEESADVLAFLAYHTGLEVPPK